MVKIYAVKLTDKIESFAYSLLLSYVSEEKRRKIERFKFWEDAHRSLLAEVLVRSIICSQLKIRNESIEITTNEYGKPFLRDNSDLQFNISHSGKWVVCAVDTSSIGVDVELIHQMDLDIANHFFSKEESAYINSKTGYERLVSFFDIWTLKESYIKAIGKGLSIPLNSFTIKFDNNGITVQAKGEEENYYFKQYNVDNEYKMSICALNKDFPTNIKLMTIPEIIKKLS